MKRISISLMLLMLGFLVACRPYKIRNANAGNKYILSDMGGSHYLCTAKGNGDLKCKWIY